MELGIVIGIYGEKLGALDKASLEKAAKLRNETAPVLEDCSTKT
jgi:hypothetical protein